MKLVHITWYLNDIFSIVLWSSGQYQSANIGFEGELDPREWLPLRDENDDR